MRTTCNVYRYFNSPSLPQVKGIIELAENKGFLFFQLVQMLDLVKCIPNYFSQDKDSN